MKKILGAILMAGLASGAAAAKAPTDSLRPQLRPVPAETAAAMRPAPRQDSRSAATPAVPAPAPRPVAAPMPAGTATAADLAGHRPVPRGGLFAPARTPADSLVQVSRQMTRIHFGAEGRPSQRPPHPLDGFTVSPAALVVPLAPDTPHPKARPAGFGKLFKRRERYSSKGSVCSVNAIRGTAVATIGRPSSGCGIENPVRVTEVAGVRLSTPIKVDCTTARALHSWVETALKPSVGKRGGGAGQIKVAASYACRSRNNIPGGKLSEHARGRAIDISGFWLKDGTEVTVLRGWNSKTWSKTMRTLHRAACGPFGTVLGPKANRYHLDHFHFDTARYRSGAYCR